MNVFLVNDCCLISEPSVVSTDGLSSRMVHHRTLRKTRLGCTAAGWTYWTHKTVWISSSKCWNYSNSVNICCFAVYMTLYWRRWYKGVTHFLAPCIRLTLAIVLDSDPYFLLGNSQTIHSTVRPTAYISWCARCHQTHLLYWISELAFMIFRDTAFFALSTSSRNTVSKNWGGGAGQDLGGLCPLAPT